MGLDVGSKTIGVAISDDLRLLAHPHCVVSRQGTKADVATVLQICNSSEISEIVVGWPLELSGKVGPRALRVKVLIDALAAASELPIHLWDERFSTAAAERMMISSEKSRKKRKESIDQEAAAYILQGWLDAQKPAG